MKLTSVENSFPEFFKMAWYLTFSAKLFIELFEQFFPY